jgi:mannose-6-phosphate isomerase-like protein (cupin superfamily)
MNEQAYIASGILESYCLGLLNPEEAGDVLQTCKLYPLIHEELNLIEKAMEQVALELAIAPRTGFKEHLINTLFGTQVLNVESLPLTDVTSDLDEWLNALAHLIPDEHVTDFYHHLLRKDDLVTQSLVISKVNIADETHEDLIESFFILEGSCRCMIDNKSYILNAGDFLEIPLYQHHDVVLLTPYVIAVHQQLALTKV